jgi:hypothetical protein
MSSSREGDQAEWSMPISVFFALMAALYFAACIPLLGFIIPSPGWLISIAFTGLLQLTSPPGAAGLAFAWFWTTVFNLPFSILLIIGSICNLLSKKPYLAIAICSIMSAIHILSALLYWQITISGILPLPVGITYIVCIYLLIKQKSAGNFNFG